MYATFHIPPSYAGPCTAAESKDQDEESPIYNSYYQWIPIYLSALALVFQIPKALWTKMEGGVMKYICKQTNDSPKEKRDKLVGVSSYNYCLCVIIACR